MIYLDRQSYLRTEKLGDRAASSSAHSLKELDERAAMDILVLDVLEQASDFVSVRFDRISFRIDTGSRIEIYSFQGDVQYLYPLYLVALQYCAIRKAIGSPIRSIPLDYPEARDVMGELYGQPWGDLPRRATLKLAVIRALCPAAGPKFVLEQVRKPLDKILKEAFIVFDMDFSGIVARAIQAARAEEEIASVNV